MWAYYEIVNVLNSWTQKWDVDRICWQDKKLKLLAENQSQYWSQANTACRALSGKLEDQPFFNGKRHPQLQNHGSNCAFRYRISIILIASKYFFFSIKHCFYVIKQLLVDILISSVFRERRRNWWFYMWKHISARYFSIKENID